jgi:cation transporter-like permease
LDRAHAKTMLFVLIGAVPLVVAGAGLASFLLLRAGYGLLVGALLPFVVSLLLAAALGVALGRAAGGRRRTRDPDDV